MSDTRPRMAAAAAVALQRHGVAGMSFTQVLADSGAARGAIYHHFPGGKSQLVAEAAGRTAEYVRTQLASLPTTSPLGVVEAFLAAIRPVLAASTTGGGCAVAAVTVVGDKPADHGGRTSGGVAGDGQTLRQVADTAFGTWISALAERLTTAGLPHDDSEDLSATLVILLEGAHVLCRAAGSLHPFDHAARSALALVRSRYSESTRHS